MTDDATFRYTEPQANVIADSLAHRGQRVTTMEVTFHRFVLAEFNTHRVFSRNSASSRAIPFVKQLKRVTEAPAIPVRWSAEQRGMQGGDSLPPEVASDAEREWLLARDAAVDHAQALADMGVHKSVVNRLLEPFMWHTVIVTATSWDGFWDQRCSPLAQPEIEAPAQLMRDAYEASEPVKLGYGQWHLPYIDEDDKFNAMEYAYMVSSASSINEENVLEILRRVSTARSARVSYLNHAGERSMEDDISLFNRLVSARPLHASPLEHVCTPDPTFDLSAPGNLDGWSQFRHMVEERING